LSFILRQVAALEFDVELLYKNCANYNYEESEIVVAARQLKKQLLAIIRPAVAAAAAANGEVE
jgi:hypothetical protein